MSSFRILAVAVVAVVALSGCQRNPLLVRRSACPAVAVPYYAGDVTLFNAADTGRDAANIDVVATITNVRGACIDAGAVLSSDVTYDVVARRMQTAGARAVTLPVFASVVQGGNLLVSKQLGQVTINFADGQARAQAPGRALARVARSASTLSPELQQRITRVRKAGDLDAATDPLSDPEVRAAVRAASFEVLVGFQLDDAALTFNVTK